MIPAREDFLAAIRASAEEGARAALADERRRCESCANFAEKNSPAAIDHDDDHRLFRQIFVPLVKKIKDRAINFVSIAFWLAIALVVILLFTEVRPFAGMVFPSSQNGGH